MTVSPGANIVTECPGRRHGMCIALEPEAPRSPEFGKVRRLRAPQQELTWETAGNQRLASDTMHALAIGSRPAAVPPPDNPATMATINRRHQPAAVPGPSRRPKKRADGLQHCAAGVCGTPVDGS